MNCSSGEEFVTVAFKYEQIVVAGKTNGFKRYRWKGNLTSRRWSSYFVNELRIVHFCTIARINYLIYLSIHDLKLRMKLFKSLLTNPLNMIPESLFSDSELIGIKVCNTQYENTDYETLKIYAALCSNEASWTWLSWKAWISNTHSFLSISFPLCSSASISSLEPLAKTRHVLRKPRSNRNILNITSFTLRGKSLSLFCYGHSQAS